MALLQTQALSHLVIQASDITRSMEFYQRVFGYQVTMDLREQAANRVIGVIGGLVMQILKARDPAPATEVQILAGPPGYALAAFSVPDIEVALEALRADGLHGPEPAFVVGDVKYAFVRDPDGIMVEVIQLPDGAKALADL
jgi:catechol 2,3-dioxygenase-like lactoylglutathione lyase family enzyme